MSAHLLTGMPLTHDHRVGQSADSQRRVSLQSADCPLTIDQSVGQKHWQTCSSELGWLPLAQRHSTTLLNGQVLLK